MRNRISLLFLLLAAFIYGCDKQINIDFEAPSIQIKAVQIVSEDTVEMEIHIDRGFGAEIVGVYVEFEYITTSSEPAFKYYLEINDDERYQDHKIAIKVDTPNINYRAWAVLETTVNKYFTSHVNLPFEKENSGSSNNIKYVDLWIPDYLKDYVDESKRIGRFMRSNERLLVIVYYYEHPSINTAISIKLNDEIEILNLGIGGGPLYDSYCDIDGELPEDIAPGCYDIALYIDDTKYDVDYKIAILPGDSSGYDIERPEFMYTDQWQYPFIATHLKFDNEIYYISRFLSVAKYNLDSGNWEAKQSIPKDPNYYNAFSLGTHRGGGFNKNNIILVGMYNMDYSNGLPIELKQYNRETDKWNTITRYPGRASSYVPDGSSDIVSFEIDNKIFMGGGFERTGDWSKERRFDFWEYNITTDEWIVKNNIPFGSQYINQEILSACSSDNKGYVFTSARELWQYDPLSDKWQLLSTLNIGPYTRSGCALLFHNNKLYFHGGCRYATGIGNIDYADIWIYDLQKHEWTFWERYETLFDSVESVPTFIHDDKIYLGLGYINYYAKSYMVKIDI